MRTFYQVLNDLDNLPNNQERKEYLYSIRINPNLGRHELKRIACNILIDDNFVDKYYRKSFTESVKKHSKNIIAFFKRLSEKKLFFLKN